MTTHTIIRNSKIGKRYSSWTVLEYFPSILIDGKQKGQKVLCSCACGKQKIITLQSLASGRSQSCGCLFGKKLKECHGMYLSTEYIIWQKMKERCSNINHIAYHRYGGRGIKVCAQWEMFDQFYKDMGKRPSLNLTLDRINNDGNYEPANCRWATYSEQSKNRSKKNKIEISCKGCSAIFYLIPSRVGKQKYCTPACCSKYTRKQ